MSDRIEFEPPGSHEDLIGMHELFDQEAVWLQAQVLIDTHESLETPEIANESLWNGESSLFEELTASGDLSIIRFSGNQDYIHTATIKRLLNGWNQKAPKWDKKRKFWELCEEIYVDGIFQKIKSGELPEDTILGTVSDIPDDDVAPEEEIHTQGYRPLNHKGMVRTYHFEKSPDGSWTRVLEQISRSNSNDLSSHNWLVNAGIYPLKDSEAILANQFVSTQRHLPDRVVSVVKGMDELTGDVLYGEPRAEALRSGRVEYDQLREFSRERREQLENHSQELAKLDAELQIRVKRREISYPEKLWLIRQRQTEIIDRILLLAPEYATDARGELAAGYWHRASLDFARGDFESFERNFTSAKKSTDSRAESACGGRGIRPGEMETYTKETYTKAQEEKKNWKWKDGVCQVKTCRKKAKVGPCSVCKKCQLVFDRGGDPTRGIALPEKPQKEPNVISLQEHREHKIQAVSAMAQVAIAA